MRSARAPARSPLVLGALLAVIAAPAPAGDTGLSRSPGTVLLAHCEAALHLVEAGHRLALNDEQYAQAQACLGFVDGFLYGHGWAAWREGRDMYYCPPAGFSAAQAIPMLVAYLRAHGERLDADGHVLLFAALSNAFPCTPLSAPPG